MCRNTALLVTDGGHITTRRAVVCRYSCKTKRHSSFWGFFSPAVLLQHVHLESRAKVLVEQPIIPTHAGERLQAGDRDHEWMYEKERGQPGWTATTAWVHPALFLKVHLHYPWNVKMGREHTPNGETSHLGKLHIAKRFLWSGILEKGIFWQKRREEDWDNVRYYKRFF